MLHYTKDRWEELLNEVRDTLPDTAAALAEKMFGYRLWLLDEAGKVTDAEQIEVLMALYTWVANNNIRPLNYPITFAGTSLTPLSYGFRWSTHQPDVCLHFSRQENHFLPYELFKYLPTAEGGYMKGTCISAPRLPWDATYAKPWAALEAAALECPDFIQLVESTNWQKKR